MPKFFEVYGQRAATFNPSSNLLDAKCPCYGGQCDGGGNRHQTKIKLSNSDLRNSFAQELKEVIPGICSIDHSGEQWVVCPRRLFGFRSSLDERQILQKYEKDALLAMGLPQNTELGVWSEVYLKYDDNDSEINYHFDYIICELSSDKNFYQYCKNNNIENDLEIKSLSAIAKKFGYISKRGGVEDIDSLPNLSKPFIIEVMTASTSGSDKEAGTDIATAFRDYILLKDHNCPGINKRQVWGRMATQLFSKSAIAEVWGGKTIWLVQDKLIKNIELTTKMKINNQKTQSDSSINFLVMKYNNSNEISNEIVLDEYFEIDSGVDFSGSGNCVDILLPKIYPPKTELLKSMLRRKPVATIII